mmetsp:Transcript_32114/g.93248  ORF Transcript_32114/g.93248 Transcript_32114/m.93248 type:complete len:217 (-) Transcript_32114:4203-4853(-)
MDLRVPLRRFVTMSLSAVTDLLMAWASGGRGLPVGFSLGPARSTKCTLAVGLPSEGTSRMVTTRWERASRSCTLAEQALRLSLAMLSSSRHVSASGTSSSVRLGTLTAWEPSTVVIVCAARTGSAAGTALPGDEGLGSAMRSRISSRNTSVTLSSAALLGRPLASTSAKISWTASLTMSLSSRLALPESGEPQESTVRLEPPRTPRTRGARSTRSC